MAEEVAGIVALAAAEPGISRVDELGYSDQTHLSRDFTSIVGESPTRYAQRYPERAGHGPGTAAMLMPGGRGRDGGGSSTCSNPSLSAAGHTVAPSTSR